MRTEEGRQAGREERRINVSVKAVEVKKNKLQRRHVECSCCLVRLGLRIHTTGGGFSAPHVYGAGLLRSSVQFKYVSPSSDGCADTAIEISVLMYYIRCSYKPIDYCTLLSFFYQLPPAWGSRVSYRRHRRLMTTLSTGLVFQLMAWQSQHQHKNLEEKRHIVFEPLRLALSINLLLILSINCQKKCKKCVFRLCFKA